MNIGIGVGNAVDQILWDLLDRTPSKAFLAIVDLPTLEEQVSRIIEYREI